MKEKFRDAFTLIELLIVIAIIAILASFLFPAVSGMQERAKVTQDLNNLRQIGLATQMYLNDNDGAFFLPTGGNPWMQSLHPKYLPSWKIFQSPFDKRSPSEDDSNAPVSYGFNTNAHDAQSNRASLLSDKITNPSLFILFGPAQDSGTSIKFSGTASTSVTVDKSGGGSGGTHNNRQRIDACMGDLHVENLSWSTFINANPSSSDPNAAQRWDPAATVP